MIFDIFQFLSFLGIIFIVIFSLTPVLSLFVNFLMLILGGNLNNLYFFSMNIMTIIQIYLLVSLVSISIFNFIDEFSYKTFLLTIIGCMVIIAYIKISSNAKEIAIHHRGGVNSYKEHLISKMFYPFLIICAITFLVISGFNQILTENVISLWLFSVVSWIHNLPIIGFVLGMIGIFFLGGDYFKSKFLKK